MKFPRNLDWPAIRGLIVVALLLCWIVAMYLDASKRARAEKMQKEIEAGVKAYNNSNQVNEQDQKLIEAVAKEATK
jgi:hypothetical protein